MVDNDFTSVKLGSAEAATEFLSKMAVLKVEDVAATVEHILTAPKHVEVRL